jgi:hypothetical protein
MDGLPVTQWLSIVWVDLMTELGLEGELRLADLDRVHEEATALQPWLANSSFSLQKRYYCSDR